MGRRGRKGLWCCPGLEAWCLLLLLQCPACQILDVAECNCPRLSRTRRAGQTLFTVGSPADDIWLLESGCITCWCVSRVPERFPLTHWGQGALAHLLDSFQSVCCGTSAVPARPHNATNAVNGLLALSSASQCQLCGGHRLQPGTPGFSAASPTGVHEYY